MYLRHDTLYGRPNGRQSIVAPPVLALDKRKPAPKSAFIRAVSTERNYAARLRKVARAVGDIVREFPEGTLEAAMLIRTAMEKYARVLEPWAEAVAKRMIAEVQQRDDQSWKRAAGQIGRALEQEIATAPTGTAMRERLAEQVPLITSLPLEAAQRVHDMTIEGIAKGQRPAEIAKVILETGDVTRSRATLIATTEVSRTAATLTQVRAEHIGSTHYRWHTVHDSDVRKDHKVLDGKVFAWAEPPISDQRTGARANPGCIYRCRCWAEPLL